MASIQDVRGLDDDVQGLWIWEVAISGISGETEIPESHTFQAQSITIPEFSLGKVDVPFKSKTAHFRGKDDTDKNLSIKFFDTEAHAVYEFLWKWMDNINNHDKGGGENKADYLATITATTQGKDEETATGEWVFKNCWLKSLGTIELDYDSDENMTIDANFVFDYHEYASK